MHKCNTNIRIKIQNWELFPEMRVIQVKDDLFVTKKGDKAPEYKEIQYEDHNIQFSKLYSNEKELCGYALDTKTNFIFVQRDWYVSCINPTVDKHHSPVVLYKDTTIALRKFNTDIDSSYWYIVRKRTTL